MAERVAIMDAGRIVQTGTPRALYERPGSRLVAGFFGESNLWEGVVAADGVRVSCATLGLDVYAAGSLPPAGSRVAVVVRPEQVTLDPVPTPDDNALADGVIEDVVYLGTVSTYLVRVPHGALVRVTRQNAGAILARGSRVSVTWPAAAVVVLASWRS
jgi:ABC-type Fe3+/spermidine/putrescine transport system ATPase subunit